MRRRARIGLLVAAYIAADLAVAAAILWIARGRL